MPDSALSDEGDLLIGYEDVGELDRVGAGSAHAHGVPVLNDLDTLGAHWHAKVKDVLVASDLGIADVNVHVEPDGLGGDSPRA